MKLVCTATLLRARLRDWLSSSISNRITFAAVSLAMAVGIVIGVASYSAVAVLVQHGIKAELDSQARVTLQKLQGDLQALSDDLATMSANSFIANGLVDSLGRDTYLLPFLHEHRPPIPFKSSIVVCDFRGRPIASNGADATADDLPADLIGQALETARPKRELRRLTQGTCLVLVQPVIFPPTGQAEGALVETVNLRGLFRFETGHLGPEYSLRLLSRGDTVARLGASIGDSDVVTVRHPLAVDASLKSLDLTFEIGLSGSKAYRPLKLLALVSLLSGIALLVIVAKLAKATSLRLTQPLMSLSMTASRIAESGSLDLTAEVTGTDEVGTLAKVFNDMLKKLRGSREWLESQVESRTRELQEAHDLLEMRVAQRTGELTRANLRLEQEMETKMQLEQQLRQIQKMEAVGTLAGGIAHDFNNILTVIGAWGSLTAMQMEESDPLRQNMDHIMAATEKAAGLTRSLLAFSRKQVMNPQDAILNVIIKDVERFLLRVIGEDIELVTRMNDEVIWVHLDQGQIEQVLMNLAANARDAMPKGGMLSIETAVEALDEAFLQSRGYPVPAGKYAVITVTDSGCGMDDDTTRKIFEPFFTTKEVGKGTGLGLAMAYGIIKQHNGHITVSSEKDRGTSFKIYLPALERAPHRQRHAKAPSGSLLGGTETVLVAEDDPEVREVVEKIMREAGYHVILAADGQHAVEQFRENRERIRLVILDMIMPQKSGKAAYDEIMEMEPEAKVLFASGYTADFIQSRGELHDGAEVIMKPAEPAELLRKMREMLDRPLERERALQAG